MAEPQHAGPTKRGFHVTRSQIVGAVVAIVLVVFIATNSAVITASLIFFHVTMRLWLLLTLAAALGLVVGFLLGRKRRPSD